jgi:cytochrome b
LRHDLLVRCTHLLFALGVVSNYWLLEPGEDLHEWIGWSVAVLLVVRIAWGFWGVSEARLSRLVLAPRLLVSDLRGLMTRYEAAQGHSAAGSWMIVVMFGLTAALILTGWMQDLDAFWGEEWLQATHAWLGHSLIAAAALHVVAVCFVQVRHDVPLIMKIWFG